MTMHMQGTCLSRSFHESCMKMTQVADKMKLLMIMIDFIISFPLSEEEPDAAGSFSVQEMCNVQDPRILSRNRIQFVAVSHLHNR